MPLQTDLSIIDLNESTPRFDHIKAPNGTTYKVGLSLVEQQAIVSAISELNTRIEALETQLNQSS
jgi:hypothetical protein